MRAFWLGATSADVDLHAGFVGSFRIEEDTGVAVRVLVPSWATVWLDGAWLLDAPVRYAGSRPIWTTRCVPLEVGAHQLALHVHHDGVDTGPMPALPPFVRVEVATVAASVPVQWQAAALEEYVRAWRLNPQLGWAEDRTGSVGVDWRGGADPGWPPAVEVEIELPEPAEDACPPRRVRAEAGAAVAAGRYQERFLEVTGQPAIAFTLRDLEACEGLDGTWWRFDLGRVRLGHPRVELRAPAGARVELGYAETLTPVGLSPAIPLSNGPSANLDRYVTGAGLQVIGPVTPRGGRYLEIHADRLDVEVRHVWLEERRGLGPVVGTFRSSDPLLDEIWEVGVETLEACAEDAVIDCPTRERGQWMGDVMVALEVAASTHGDLTLIRRAIRQGRDCLDTDGFVPALFPGRNHLLPTYSALWLSTVMRYVELSADHEVLTELAPAGRSVLEAFARNVSHGTFVPPERAWCHLDWGYGAPPVPDLGTDLILLRAAHDAHSWAAQLGDAGLAAVASGLVASLEPTAWARLAASSLPEVPLQQLVLGLRAGIVPDGFRATVAREVVERLATGFPRDPAAPRLAGPTVVDRRVITPYFAHFALEVLCDERHHTEALRHIREAWGWMLQMGARTWFEVFDDRWSQCHGWTSTPTRLLTQYGLGLHRRGDRGPSHWQVRPPATGLEHAAGRVPVPGSDLVLDVRWQRQDDAVTWIVRTESALHLEAADGSTRTVAPGEHAFVLDQDTMTSLGAERDVERNTT